MIKAKKMRKTFGYFVDRYDLTIQNEDDGFVMLGFAEGAVHDDLDDRNLIYAVHRTDNWLILRIQDGRYLSDDEIPVAVSAANEWNREKVPYLFVRTDSDGDTHLLTEMLLPIDFGSDEEGWISFYFGFAQWSALAYLWLRDEFNL